MILNNILLSNDTFNTYDLVNIYIENESITNIEFVKKDLKDFNEVEFYATNGFSNLHLHPNQLFDRRLLDNLDITNLLSDMHIDYKKTYDDRYYQALFVLMDSLQNGALINYSVASNPEPVIQAYKDLNINGAVTCFFNDIWEGAGNKPRIDSLKDIELKFENLFKLQNEKIKIHIGSSSIESASNDLLIMFNEISKKYKTKVNIHIAEGSDSVKTCIKNRGTTPIKLLSKLGVLNENWNLIHAVNITEEEINIIAESKAKVIHCPVSNAKTGVGITNLKKMIEKDIKLGLGTDACSNNNTNNILNEAYFAVLLHSAINKNASILSINKVLQLLNSSDIIDDSMKNCIKVGEKANILLWDIQHHAFVPKTFRNFNSTIIFNAPDIKPYTVINGGEVIIENYKYINRDLDQIAFTINSLSEKVSDLFFKNLKHE